MTHAARCPECQTDISLQNGASIRGLLTYYCHVCEKPVKLRLAPARDDDGPGRPRAPRVLIAEDTTPVARQIADLLTGAGYSVRIAADGEATLRAAREFQPDVVLLDLVMPDTDSLSILRTLRSDPVDRVPHVLVMGAQVGSSDIIRRIHALGAAGMIPKPALKDTLLFRLQSLLH